MNILSTQMKTLYVLMSLLYSTVLMYFVLPDTMIVTIIAAIIKTNSGDLSDKNNYRPIAHDTVLSKLLE